ncbi:MerR family transcriptional regulator [Nocardia bhagyanarayanae]|uniref:MerR family transcriptional regulator n=1 Tax=Nocardia bhagyanarayanae TaxID=1215925 RepID=UPI001C8A1A37|nr:MerR family transcriptional regulator [Nocardia bhagyanarayanae]
MRQWIAHVGGPVASRIYELETRTGVGRHTLRYYERQGLLGDVHRSSNNSREYPESLVREVRLLRNMQSLGFSLNEIRQISTEYAPATSTAPTALACRPTNESAWKNRSPPCAE